MSRDFPNLGFDPAPGDPSALQKLVDDLTATRDRLAEVIDLVNADGRESWVGDAADAFRDTLDTDFRPRLTDSQEAFRVSVSALQSWHGELVEFQRRAGELESQAASHAHVAHSASPWEIATKQAQADAGLLSPQELEAFEELRGSVQSASSQLASLRQQAHQLQGQTDGAAQVTADQLVSIVELVSAMQGSVWEQIGSAIADGFDWFMDNVMPIIKDLVDLIGPIVGILSLFFPALATLALILAVVSVAINALRALHGEEGALGEMFIGIAGLAFGGALSAGLKSIGGGTLQVFMPTISGATPALAGGGTAAGSVAAALTINGANATANSYWLATTVTDAAVNNRDIVQTLAEPGQNLIERVQNLVAGQGPRTDQELMDGDDD